MSGSGASIMGYGCTDPNSNVSGEFVNKMGSNYAGNFGSNVVPSSAHSMPEPSSNVVAASGTWTGTGGRKNIGTIYKMKAGKSRSRKIRHTSHRTKRNGGVFRRVGKLGRRVDKSVRRVTKGSIGMATGLVRGITKRTRKMLAAGRRRNSRRHRKSTKKHHIGGKRRRFRGGMGYDQFQSNVPYTPGYAVADVNLGPGMSSLANPPPIEPYNHCQDNYNHYAATQGA